MGLFTALPEEIQEVDVVIAGGGSAGCIIAARLSDADPSLSILVVEGGPNNDNILSVTHPALLLSHLAPDSKYNLYYKSNKSDALDGRQLVVSAGGLLGGGSSVNLMVYSRAQRSDFDAWKAPGWTADDMLGYMKKLETYHGPDQYDCHGSTGPMHISGAGFRSSRLEDDFISSATAAGWPEFDDLQTMDAVNGVQRAMRYVDPDGKRQDTAHQYLHPRMEDGNHPNLHVLLESQVKRVVFDGRKVSGVEYQPNPAFQQSQPPTIHTVKVNRMVIVACGALGSPLVLERSGIGGYDILNAAGVPPVANIPGVGRQYQDHHMMIYSYKSSLTQEETLDALCSGRLKPQDLIDQKDGLLGWNTVDASCKLRPQEAEVVSLGPAFEKMWHEEFKLEPDKPLMMASLCGCYPGNPTEVPEGQYFSIAVFSTYPRSRGHIHITSRNLSQSPNFDAGFLSDPEGVDIKMHLWMYKMQRHIAQRMGLFRGEVTRTHPQFSTRSQAACTDGEPLPNTLNPEYDDEDDQAIEHWIRQNIGSTWHSLGTCKMAALDEGGVVDDLLSVYGVQGLKVADLSVPPSNIAANSNNVAMAIAEKAADIFIKELGLGK